MTAQADARPRAGSGHSANGRREYESPGRRFERSSLGRAVISLVVVLVMAIQFFWNIPSSELRDVGVRAVGSVALGVGFDQNWGVFAPNPRRVTLDLYAIAEYPDGSTRTWELPKHDEPFFEPYRTYRWRKWMSWARLNRYEDTLWEPAARWIMKDMSKGGQAPSRVTLVRRWYDLPEPGSGDPLPSWNEFRYFTLEGS